MKKIVKQNLSRICAFTLCCMLVFSSYGSIVLASDITAINTSESTEFTPTEINALLTKNSTSVDTENVAKINSDMETLSKIGLVWDAKGQVSEVTIDNNDNVSYLIDYGEYENLISIISNSPERIEMYAQQGDISNVMVIHDDGRIYLDGNLVEFGNSMDEVVVANNMEMWLASPPYGTISSYSVYDHLDCSRYIGIGQSIANVTFSFFLGLFLASAGAPLWIQLAGNPVATEFYSKVKAYDPYSNYASYKALVYTRSGGAWINSTYGWCWKYKFNFYASSNYTNYAGNRSIFRQMLPY